MSLSPKDMDFMETKHAAAREIALAFGVPPMMLAILGDNTYGQAPRRRRAKATARDNRYCQLTGVGTVLRQIKRSSTKRACISSCKGCGSQGRAASKRAKK